jgi:hypothetical protein
VILAGCDNRHHAEGTVTVKGTLLNHGLPKFRDGKGAIKTAAINPDGTYQLDRPPSGDVTVTVETDPARAGAGKPQPPPRKDIPAIEGRDGFRPTATDVKYKQIANGVTLQLKRSGRHKVDIAFP